MVHSWSVLGVFGGGGVELVPLLVDNSSSGPFSPMTSKRLDRSIQGLVASCRIQLYHMPLMWCPDYELRQKLICARRDELNVEQGQSARVIFRWHVGNPAVLLVDHILKADGGTAKITYLLVTKTFAENGPLCIPVGWIVTGKTAAYWHLTSMTITPRFGTRTYMGLKSTSERVLTCPTTCLQRRPHPQWKWHMLVFRIVYSDHCTGVIPHTVHS